MELKVKLDVLAEEFGRSSTLQVKNSKLHNRCSGSMDLAELHYRILNLRMNELLVLEQFGMKHL